MKKLLLLIICMLFFSSCMVNKILDNKTELSDISVTTIQEIPAPAGIQPPLIKVNGASYRLQSIANEDDITEYLFDENYLGTITQDVDETQLPERDLTSNCGLIGMSVYYMNDFTIIVKIPSELNIWKPQNYSHEYIYYYCLLENIEDFD